MLNKIIVVATTVCALALVPVGSSAQTGDHGTVQTKEVQAWGLVWWDGHQTLAVQATDPDFFVDLNCSGTGYPEPGIYYHEIRVLQTGKINYTATGRLFTRIYSPAVPDDFWSDICGFLTSRQRVAEGIATFKQNDHNSCELGPGQNTAFWRSSGTLYDLTGQCPSGMVAYEMLGQYQWENVDPVSCLVAAPSDIKVIKEVGPRVTCAK